MKLIWGYIKNYKQGLNPAVFLWSASFMALLIYLNYSVHLEQTLTRTQYLPVPGFTGHLLLFAGCFCIPYLITTVYNGHSYWKNSSFWLLAAAAVIIFSIKVSGDIPLPGMAPGYIYWNSILYWPVRLLFILTSLFLLRRYCAVPLYGLSFKKTALYPYFIMLGMMVPLIGFASTQPDFLQMYPKLKTVIPYLPDALPPFVSKLLFELSYGSDFISIELFFRGFLIFSFIKFAGKDAILPMACFYCSIHFGKPLFECISSFWGGLLLGILSYNTRKITGGLIIHLGIAWMMEWGGYLGNGLK